MSTSGDILNTFGVFSTSGGYHDSRNEYMMKGYDEYIGGV